MSSFQKEYSKEIDEGDNLLEQSLPFLCLNPDCKGYIARSNTALRSKHAIYILCLSNAALLCLTVVLLLRGYFAGFCEDPSLPKPSWLPPEIPVKIVPEFNRMYGRPPDEENIKAWNDLMPNGRGFVTIQNETALPEMPQLNQSNPVQHALISVFHQLHCLWATKDSYFNLRDGKANETDVLHLSHCWDYLRQTIQCHADTTLEWMPNPTQHASRGWGYEHECRDFNAVYAWAEENKMKSSSGIH